MDAPDVARAGPIALVGSGEYLPQMEETDRLLLAQVGGASARVVVLPTAAGLEDPSSPRRWGDLGVRHFSRLGAKVEVANILTREDAFNDRWQPLLEQADFIYFSGGSPRHVVDTMADSPAWQIIRARHAAGAVLAGCSAGAMAFGQVSLQPRRVWSGRGNGTPPNDIWYQALGLVPNVVVLPHFDRWMSRLSDATLRQLAASLPAEVTLIGVDEDTAVVTLQLDEQASWQVMGRRGVSVIDPVRGQMRFAAGETVVLARATTRCLQTE